MTRHDSDATLAPGDRAEPKIEALRPAGQRTAAARPSRLASTKVHERHLARLAIVYIRQSTPYQVQVNVESKARQYALWEYAVALGWPSERVLVIDEDQGQSGKFADGRLGFQRLLAEVSMDHVGIVVGLELSRLSRSCKDWHHLLEVCAVFGTLLADQDGVYDPNDPNDRLLLGLRGTISEVELHTMRNRLHRGKLNKAERGELFMCLPIGYAWSPSHEVVMEPDEQARGVVHLIFEKFAELGTAYAVFYYLLEHDIKIGVRPHDGPNPGVLTWRRPSVQTIYGILHNPMHAGTYAYGRCPMDHKRQVNRNGKRARKWVPREEWKVTIPDRVPAYITWEQYLHNQERLRQNKSCWDAPGVPRPGVVLLGGIIECGICQHRLNVIYSTTGKGRYDCFHANRHGIERKCKGIAAYCIDQLVSRQVLRALEPASLELSLRAAEDIQKERKRLAELRQQEVQRARYEAQRAERHYRSVDPENRLVASTLEREWEKALGRQRQLEEDLHRFEQATPRLLTTEEREQIRALSADLPSLWNAPETTAADHKEISRHLIDKVVVTAQGATEHIDVSIHWKGGFVSQHAIVRRVQKYEQLRDFDAIMETIRAGHAAGLVASQIAERLQQAGYPTIDPAQPWNNTIVCQLLARSHLKPGRAETVELAADEWMLSDLLRELEMGGHHMRNWIVRRWVHWRHSPLRAYYVIWADADELKRLRKLKAFFHAHSSLSSSLYPKDLITPKRKPAEQKKRDG